MVVKSVENIDETLWRKFVAKCKIKGVRVGDELNSIMKREVG